MVVFQLSLASTVVFRLEPYPEVLVFVSWRGVAVQTSRAPRHVRFCNWQQPTWEFSKIRAGSCFKDT